MRSKDFLNMFDEVYDEMHAANGGAQAFPAAVCRAVY